jgi:4-amino-4-deoxy-L-arabinose transferase-like glycosyltransferase
MDVLYAFLVCTGIFLVSLGIGTRLYALLDREYDNEFVSFLLALGLGTGSLSLLLFGLGMVEGFSLPVMLVLFVGGIGAGGRAVFQCLTGVCGEFAGMFSRLGVYRLWIALIGLVALLNGLAAATPPIDIDVLNYHLAVPHIYVLHHRMLQIPGIYFSYFPLNIQLLYVPCLVLGSPEAAQLLHVMFGLATMCTIGWLAHRFHGLNTAVLAALIFYVLLDVQMETPVARIDLGVSFYALLAFLCFTLARDNQRSCWLVLCGIFAGLCAGSKYTGLIVPLLMLVLLFLFQSSALSITRRTKHLFIVAIVASLIPAPWYIRNAVWTGNPLFPFFTEFWGQGFLSTEQIEMIQAGNWQYAPIPRTFLNFLFSPWLLLIRREAFASNRIGPLFLAYLPLYLMVRWRRVSYIYPLLIFVGLWAIFWFWTSPLIRFFFAPLGLLCILLAQALRLALRYNAYWRIVSVCTLSLWVTFALTWNVKNHIQFVKVATGITPVDQFLEQIPELDGYHYADFRHLADVQPELLLLFDSHGFYVEQPFILASDWALEHQAIIHHCEPSKLKSVLQTSGITHILLHDDLKSADPIEIGFFRCLTASNLLEERRLIYSENKTRLFEM